MVKIDKKYDVVLTYSPIIEITGHIFECFDYYLFLKQFFKVGILFFNGLKKEALRVAFDSKYNVPFSSIEEDLIIVDGVVPMGQKQIISFCPHTTVIVADGNIRALEYYNIIFATKHLYGFLCEYDNFHEVHYNSNIIFLQDYRVYGKNEHFNSLDYVKKLPFKFYKKSVGPNKNIGLIYMTYVCRKVSPDVLLKYHKMSGCTNTLLLVPYKLPEYDCIPNIQQCVVPLEDLFSKFDTYIYTPVNRKFDCSPRLVTECFMQGKNVYKNLDYYDVGLETRYNDCIRNLSSLDLVENDPILSIVRRNLVQK